MSVKGLWLFIAAGVFWGLPYFFIEWALESFSTQSIVFARVAIGAAILLPYAAMTGGLKPALKAWPYVLAFAILEMVGPWWLITESQKHITSGLAGLMVATVPFFAVAILAIFLHDRTALKPVPLTGMVIGFIGVVSLIGIDSIFGLVNPLWVGAVALGALGYAIAPIMASRKIAHVPTAGVIGLSMLAVTIIYAPFALPVLPAELAAGPTSHAIAGVLVLGIVCSALAFVIFFALIKEVGPVKASLITYVNTAVALLLGTLFLGEPITPGLIFGIPLITVGLYLSAKK